MQIAYANEWADEARAAGGDYAAVRAEIQRRATADTPMYLGTVTSINCDTKTDRYVAKVANGHTTSTVKLTNETAAFILTNGMPNAYRTMLPSVYARMTDGVIDDVLLLFLSRD